MGTTRHCRSPTLSAGTTAEANPADSGSNIDKLSADNESLHAELAKARQQFRVTVGELDLVKEQLKDANAKLANQAGIDLSADSAGQATTLDTVSIEGVVVGRDKNMVRIELPRAQLFNANTATISNDGKTLLDRVGAAVKTTISQSANNARSPCRIRPDTS